MSFLYSGDYTFYVVEEPIYDYDDDFNKIATDEINIKYLSLIKQPYPCAEINLDKQTKNKIAILNLVNYYKSCSVKEKELEQHEGTIRMIQTLLTYVIQRYPHISSVEIQDETFIHVPGKPLITSRRLLLGQKGWYEEYLGALPKERSFATKLRFLRHPTTQEKVRSLLPPEAQNKMWWIPENIVQVADSIDIGLLKYIIGSHWTISAATIKTYDIKMDIEPVPQKQSGGFQRKIKRVYRGAPFSHVSYHRLRTLEMPPE